MQNSRHGKYLGLPIIISKSKMEVFAKIKERVGKKLAGWKEKMLSMGGREILFKTVAQAIPTYTMSCFQLPKCLCDEMEGMMRIFWWGQCQQESKIAWVGWRKLCKSKDRGGMGFRDLQAFNLALLAKQGWRLLTNPDSLGARIYKARYYPHGDVLKAKPGSNPSYTWRSIRNGLEVIRKGTRWRVGNENLIHIWEDKWLPTPTTYKVISPPRFFDGFPMVSNLIDKDTRRWKADLVRTLFLPFEATTILNIPLSYSLPEDKIIWVGNKKGEFTVKSAYYIALNLSKGEVDEECSSGDCRAPLWKRIWHLKIPSKIRIFGWRACLNGLPTAENLKKRGINTSELCPCCEKEPESITHSLLRCEIAKKVWNCWWECPIDIPSSQWDFSDVALEILAQGTTMDPEAYFVTAWSIWYNRNQVVHESICQLPNHIWNFTKRYLPDYKEASSFFGQDKTAVVGVPLLLEYLK